jgi:hypothetical protein
MNGGAAPRRGSRRIIAISGETGYPPRGLLTEVDMPDDATTRWDISVSAETDRAVRSFLTEHGLKTTDLPRFVEEAVRWRVFDKTLEEVRARFADMAEADSTALIDEAVLAARQPDATRAV